MSSLTNPATASGVALHCRSRPPAPELARSPEPSRALRSGSRLSRSRSADSRRRTASEGFVSLTQANLGVYSVAQHVCALERPFDNFGWRTRVRYGMPSRSSVSRCLGVDQQSTGCCGGEMNAAAEGLEALLRVLRDSVANGELGSCVADPESRIRGYPGRTPETEPRVYRPSVPITSPETTSSTRRLS